MLDPLSLTAITATLGAVGMGMANEAGKQAWESAGGLVRRIAGREVPAPDGPRDLDALAHTVHDGVRRDPAHARAWLALARGVPDLAHAPRPRPEFPSSTRFFTDREKAMRKLDREASRRADGRPRIALLHGGPGMGTSALAVHWGCREAARFPDGQLYVDLRGSATGGALDAGTALRSLLRQLGVPGPEVPPSAEDRIRSFRGLLADRRVLVVLDHAHSAAQVRPLVPAAPGVFVLVVAAGPLAGLDAVPVPVEPLEDRDARLLLTDLVGKEAVSRADAALPALLARCGGSPFALRAAAPELTAPPARRPPEAPAVSEPPPGDPVRAAAESAYRSLTPDAARVHRLMSLRPWPAFGPAAASWATGAGEAAAGALLDELAAAHLLERTDSGRFFHRPAVRAHAEEAAVREDRVAGCSAAVTRVVAGYLRFTLDAAHAVLPQSWRVPPRPGELPPRVPYARPADAVEALVAERGNLVQAVHAAEEFGDAETVVLLARALWPLQLKAGYHDELLPALRLAARTADTRFPRSRTAGALHAQVAHSLTELRRWDEAEEAARAAAENERAAGHARGHASAVEFLGLLRLRQWRFSEAYACFEESGRRYGTIGPDDEGAEDLERAHALLERHRGRALRGLGRFEEAREWLHSALRCFRASGDAYNTARTLTDLADTAVDAGDPAAAPPLIDEASALLTEEGGHYHLVYLRALRERCVSPPPA
ncbi:hypothetical protein GCM10009801_36560 [Streptomyces albiaxialis]|uniref:Uncharacterized protein n=1 Tax=Streptomyces albiaxialis TaxID=329523 RepID=A0ABN2W167_9ACTN